MYYSHFAKHICNSLCGASSPPLGPPAQLENDIPPVLTPPCLYMIRKMSQSLPSLTRAPRCNVKQVVRVVEKLAESYSPLQVCPIVLTPTCIQSSPQVWKSQLFGLIR